MTTRAPAVLTRAPAVLKRGFDAAGLFVCGTIRSGSICLFIVPPLLAFYMNVQTTTYKVRAHFAQYFMYLIVSDMLTFSQHTYLMPCVIFGDIYELSG